MQRTESPNNTPEQVHAYLVATLTMLEDVAIPEDLRPAAFEQVFQAFAGKQILWAQPQPVTLPGLGGLGRRH